MEISIYFYSSIIVLCFTWFMVSILNFISEMYKTKMQNHKKWMILILVSKIWMWQMFFTLLIVLSVVRKNGVLIWDASWKKVSSCIMICFSISHAIAYFLSWQNSYILTREIIFSRSKKGVIGMIISIGLSIVE